MDLVDPGNLTATKYYASVVRKYGKVPMFFKILNS